ncbi:MAG: trypsin-like peptidase domain-containing protein [Pirellulaceae bacterium]
MNRARSTRWILWILAVVWSSAGLPSTAYGEEAKSLAHKLGPLWQRIGNDVQVQVREHFVKHNASMLSAYRPVIEQARQSTVRIVQDDSQLALGVIISRDGYILTKASELAGQEVTVELPDGERVPGKICDKSESWDLALVRIEAQHTDLTPAVWSNSDSISTGSLVASTGTSPLPISIGTLSVATRPLTKAFLGIIMDPEPNGGVRIRQVQEGSAASKAGIQVDDVVVAIDQDDVTEIIDLASKIGGRRPGESVTVKLKRGADVIEITVVLGERNISSQTDEATGVLGISLSKNRSGYPSVMQTDMFLRPEDCGGPVVDLDGKIVGLNIARVDRIATYAIPGNELQTMLDVDENNRITFARPMDVLQDEYEKAQMDLREKMKAMEASMDQLKSHERALERARARESNRP